MKQRLLNALPTPRDVMVSLLAFVLTGFTCWVIGGETTAQTAGYAITFNDGHVFAPTVREGDATMNDRITRGMLTVLSPLLGEHPATGRGNQSSIRERSLAAAEAFYGKELAPPTSWTKAGRVNGGSSGLAWAIAALAAEQPDLLGGRNIAASAVLYANGDTYNVGGLEYKTRTPRMAVTDVMFVNVAQAVATRRLFSGFEHRPIVLGVANLDQAIGLLCAASGPGPVCDRYRSNNQISDRARLTVQLSAGDSGACRAVRDFAPTLSCRIRNGLPFVITPDTRP